MVGLSLLEIGPSTEILIRLDLHYLFARKWSGNAWATRRGTTTKEEVGEGEAVAEARA